MPTAYSYRSRIRARACLRRGTCGYSNPSTRPSRAAWVSDCLYAVRSSLRMAADYGRLQTNRAEPSSNSPYQSMTASQLPEPRCDSRGQAAKIHQPGLSGIVNQIASEQPLKMAVDTGLDQSGPNEMRLMSWLRSRLLLGNGVGSTFSNGIG